MREQKEGIHKILNCYIYSKSNGKNLSAKKLTCIASVKCFRVVLE